MHIAGTYLKDRRPNETKYYMHQGSIPVYEYNNSGRLVEKCYGDTDLPRLSGAGAWCGSTAELSRFIASIDGLPHVKDILSKKSIEFMTREQADHQYSIGWNYTPKSNKPWIRTGSLAGTSAIVICILLSVSEGITIAISPSTLLVHVVLRLVGAAVL